MTETKKTEVKVKKSQQKAEVKVGKKTVVKTTAKKVVAKKPVEAEVAARNGLACTVLDTKGSVIESLALPEHIFGVAINPQLIAQAVRVYLVNQRQGNASTKTRGEVEGSTRKIYRQKGTGRARHGGIRAPIFVKGGIAHGPKPKEYALHMPKKMRSAALLSALSSKAKDGGILLVSGLESLEAKTKSFAGVFTAWNLVQKGRDALLVLPKDIEQIYRAARNLSGVTITTVDRLNTYEVLQHKVVVFMKDSIHAIEKNFEGKK